jgi:hypothetical protein
VNVIAASNRRSMSISIFRADYYMSRATTAQCRIVKWRWSVSEYEGDLAKPTAGQAVMSESGQGRSSGDVDVISAFPLIATTERTSQPSSFVGKRNFPGQRQRPRNAPCNPIGRLQRQNACTNRRQFGAIHTEPGNPRLRRTAWWGWEDSNFQPNDYQPRALSMRTSVAMRRWRRSAIKRLRLY